MFVIGKGIDHLTWTYNGTHLNHCLCKCLSQVVEKTERVFNASSTLTPDSIMSDESLSRDWQLAEPLPGTCSKSDIPQGSLESDVRQFSNISAEAVKSVAVHNNSTDKCERSDVSESSQLHNHCLLSGIDVSSVNSDANISVGSADVSTVAELNEARLSAGDANSSINSTLKGSDTDESPSKHDNDEVATSHPTFAVSIPISTVFELETKDSQSVSTGVVRPAGQVYSPISDAGDDTPSCQSPLRQLSGPATSSRSVREFSPISPFTPRQSVTDTPVPVVPLCWSSNVSALAAPADTSLWCTDGSVAESQYYSDKFVTATVPSPDYFTFKHSSTHSHQSAVGGGTLIRPMKFSIAGGNSQVASCEEQNASIFQQQAYWQQRNEYPSPMVPDHHLTHSHQSYTYCANTVGNGLSTNSLHSAKSRRHDAAQLPCVEAGKSNVCLRTAGLMSGADKHAVSSHHEIASVHGGRRVNHPTSAHGNDRFQSCATFSLALTLFINQDGHPACMKCSSSILWSSGSNCG